MTALYWEAWSSPSGKFLFMLSPSSILKSASSFLQSSVRVFPASMQLQLSHTFAAGVSGVSAVCLWRPRDRGINIIHTFRISLRLVILLLRQAIGKPGLSRLHRRTKVLYIPGASSFMAESNDARQDGLKLILFISPAVCRGRIG